MAEVNHETCLIDIPILLLTAIPILLFQYLGKPYERGFFCDDQSLMHPFHEDTIPTASLAIVGVVIPVSTILCTEYSRARRNQPTFKPSFICGHKIPKWLENSCHPLLLLAFGSAAGQLVTDIAKYSIGRLRPHFFAVCQPLMPDGTTCANPKNHGRYIVDMKCLAVGSTADQLREARMSFPSGHSSYTTFTMVFCMVYLQHRLNCPKTKLWKHFLQLILALTAWFIVLSRISDYKHHWSDVLVGVLIGLFNALIVMNFVGVENSTGYPR